MSTMIENHWDPRLQNQNGPITSGFVSNSDIRQRERADQIKWERQREYEDMMNKKREAENKRKEELYLNSQRNYKPPPEPEMYDHHQISKDLREERQKEYNDYLPQDKQKPIDEVRTGFFDDRRQSPLNRDERQHEYQEYLAKKQHDDDMRRQKLDEQRHAPRPDISKGDYYDADAYERKKQNLNSQRREEYQDYLSKQKEKGSSRQEEELDDYQSKRRHALAQERNQEYNQFLIQQANRPSYRMYTPEDMQGLPLSQNRYEAQRKDQERQRNKEYNEHLAKKGEKVTSEEDPLSRRDLTLKKYMENQMRSEMHDKFRDPSGNEIGPDNFGLPIGQFRYEDWQKHLKEERTKEYHELQAQKYGNQPVRRAPDQPNPNSIGFVANMGRHEQERSRLGKQRQDEYKKFLDEKIYPRDGVPFGRPNWVDGKDSWYRQEPPPFHHSPGPDRAPEQRPDSYGRRQTPSYQDILDSKRKEEASYRRFDDPEYSRGGAPPGGPYDRYDHHDRPGSYDRRPLSREPMGRPGERPMSNGRPLGASPLDRYGSDGRPF